MAVAFLILGVGTRPASAEPVQPIRDAIRVDAGATCLDPATLVDQIRTWLGSDVVEANVFVKVEGSRDQGRVVRFEATRAGRVIADRRFDPGPAECENLHAAIGLAIAMALSASLTDEMTGRAAHPPPSHRGSPPAEGPAREWSYGASALAALDVLPGTALGVDARFQWSFTSTFALRFGAIALAGMPGPFEGTSGGYDSELLAAHADVCAGSDVGRGLRIQGCAGLAAGAVVAHGHSFTVSQTAVAPWLAVADTADLLIPLNRSWSLDLSLGMIFPVQRMSLIVQNRSGAVVATQDLASAGDFAGIGAIYRF